MPRPPDDDEPQYPNPIEEFRLVRAGPNSHIGYRVPSVRELTMTEHLGRELMRRVLVTLKIELELVDNLYAGRYVLREFAVRDGELEIDMTTGKLSKESGGITPELIRSLPFASLIATAALKGAQAVTIDPDTGRVVDHLAPDETLTTDELVVLNWLQAKLCGLDTNKIVAAGMEISPAAAAQRIARLRKAGQLPPATTPGGRR